MESLKLKALIVDDEPLAHDVIIRFAKDVPDLEIIGQSFLALDALEFLKHQSVDLIFLDIQMPKLKGLEFLRLLDNKPMVIITSAYEKYALESFDLEVIDYLLKPYRFDRFLKAVRRASDQRQLKVTQSSIESQEDSSPQQLFIKSDKRFIQIQIENIYYLESHGNYVKVWQKEGFHLTPKTLQSFENLLPAPAFFRIHKSTIVNKRYIDYLEGNQIRMQNGTMLNIGRNHRQRVKQWITEQEL
ncbi:MAG: LytTR family DNA-binding domain-containing protein [Saprospiraceae bacterium]|nr:LytTR family DNA-binding domain-containing protein [Saprospiraceae bacterium]